MFVHFLCDCPKKIDENREKASKKKACLLFRAIAVYLKEMRFAAARFFPKIGRLSLKRENLQHCIPFRVASNRSRFFTLETAQFLNGKNRKAACDFGTATYFRK